MKKCLFSIFILVLILMLFSCGEIPDYSDMYTLTINVRNQGSVTPFEGEQRYWSNSNVQLVATPNTGWIFKGWEGDVDNPDLANTTIFMDSNKTITAVFAREEKVTQEETSNEQGEVVINTDDEVINIRITNEDGDPLPNIQTTLVDDGDEKALVLIDETGEYYPNISYLADINSNTRNTTVKQLIRVSQTSSDKELISFELDRTLLNFIKNNLFTSIEENIKCEDLYDELSDYDDIISMHFITRKRERGTLRNFVWSITALDINDTDQYNNWYHKNISTNGFTNKDTGNLYNIEKLEGNNIAFTIWPDEWRSDITTFQIKGKVVDEDNKGINRVEIKIDGKDIRQIKVFTNNSGIFQTGGLIGEITLTPKKEGITFDPDKITVDEETEDIVFVAVTPTQETYTLSLVSNPIDGGEVSGGGSYAEGDKVNITATPNEGYDFINWTKGSQVISTNTNFQYTMPDENTTLTANFEEEATEPTKYTLTMQKNGEGDTNPNLGDHLYNENENVNIIATPKTGWKFKEWIGDVANNNIPNTTVTMDEDKTVKAVFEEDDSDDITEDIKLKELGKKGPLHADDNNVYYIDDLTTYGQWTVSIRVSNLPEVFKGENQFKLIINEETYLFEENPLEDDIQEAFIPEKYTEAQIENGIFSSQ